MHQFGGTISGLNAGSSTIVPTNAINIQATVTGAVLSGNTITVYDNGTTVATLALAEAPVAGTSRNSGRRHARGHYDVFLDQYSADDHLDYDIGRRHYRRHGRPDAGKVVTITLNASQAVTVTGSPTLALNDSGTASYTGGSGTNSLTFTYTVAAGQNTSDLTVIGVNGTITGPGGDALARRQFAIQPGGTLQIDTTAPSLTAGELVVRTDQADDGRDLRHGCGRQRDGRGGGV